MCPNTSDPCQPEVRTLTEEDLASGRYTIFDVLMPQFG